MSTAPQLLGGRYEVGELIGRGGMAEVHVGHDTRLGRTVAIKMLRADLARDTSFLARFRREAQAAAGLNHPAIVAVYDSGEQPASESGGATVHIPYIIMEHVDGTTLRETLNAERVLDPDEAARVTAGVLSALEFSHEKGIVHRDIKPANVMITRGGAVKVMDFGIARALADTAATMTQTQAVLGTARYLSPEQARGDDVDARSDLYSAGCLFYELLAGRTPFVGDPVSLVYQHLGEAPQPPSVHEPGVPPAMDAVTLHALVKDRDARYQHAREFRDDLQAARAGRPVSAAAEATAAVASAAAAAPTTGAAGVGATQGLRPPPRDGRRVPDRDDTAEIPVGQEKRHRGGYVLLGVLAVLALAGLGWAAVQAFSPGDDGPLQVNVPYVIGDSEGEARAELEGDNLVPVVEYEPNRQRAEGEVVDQSPQANEEVDEGSTVTLTVSSGPDAVTVPDVTGFAQESAITQLENSNLVAADDVEVVHDPEFAEGRVVRTEPAAEANVPRDSTVTLFVASGQVEVPELAGLTETQASLQLAEHQLEVGEISREVSDQPEDTVLAQSREPGDVVDYGTAVGLTLAEAAIPTETVTATVTDSPTTDPDPTTTSPDPTSPEPTPTSPEPTTTGPSPTVTRTSPTPTTTTTEPPEEAAGPGRSTPPGRGPGGDGPPGQTRGPGGGPPEDGPPGQGRTP